MTSPAPRAPAPVLIVWLAIVGSLPMFLVLGWLQRQQAPVLEAPVEGPFASLAGAAPVEVILGLVLCAVGTVVARRFFPVPADYQTWVIVRTALAESVAILGFVGFTLGATFSFLGLFVLASLGIALLSFPGDGDRRAWEALCAERSRTRRG